MLDILEHVFNLIIARAKLQGYVNAKFSTLGSQAAMVAVSHATSCSQALGGNVGCGLQCQKFEHHVGHQGPTKSYLPIFLRQHILKTWAFPENPVVGIDIVPICTNMYSPRPPKAIMETIARASSKEGGGGGSGDSCADVNPLCNLPTCWSCPTCAYMFCL